MNCDVLFHAQLLSDLLTSRHEDALLMAADAGRASTRDEEMKIRVRARPRRRDRQDARPGRDGRRERRHRQVRRGRRRDPASTSSPERWPAAALRDWVPRAFGAFARIRPLHAVDTRGFPWTEIDFPEDYWRACAEVLPAIEDEPSSAAGATSHARDHRSAADDRVWESAHTSCMNASTNCASGPSLSARIRTISIRAACTRKR